LFQSRFNGGFEWRQIVLNRQPDANGVDSVVFVAQEVSYGAQLGPRDSGAQFLSHGTEFLGRLADPLQTALCALLVLRSSLKAVKSMPAVNSSIRAMFSKMSSKR
jgi:hypothetical protein